MTFYDLLGFLALCRKSISTFLFELHVSLKEQIIRVVGT